MKRGSSESVQTLVIERRNLLGDPFIQNRVHVRAVGGVHPKKGLGWMFESILCQVTEYDPDVLESLIGLAVEIAREGREGRRVGTLFTVGDENAVLARSRPLILDPLSGHPKASLHVTNLNLRGTIKELAQLDGGFAVSREGVFLSAPQRISSTRSLCRPPTSSSMRLPLSRPR